MLNCRLSGSFRKLSKLVVILVMLRGRHRGLPVAIDRAVMLPKDFTVEEEQALEETRSRRYSRRGSIGVSDEFLAGLRRDSMSNYSGRRDSSLSDPIARDTYIQPTQTATRRGSSPQGTMRSKSSNPTTSPNPSASLSFSIPRTSTERSDPRTDPRTRSPVAMRGGNLTPVAESAMSRANTRTD